MMISITSFKFYYFIFQIFEFYFEKFEYSADSVVVYIRYDY